MWFILGGCFSPLLGCRFRDAAGGITIAFALSVFPPSPYPKNEKTSPRSEIPDLVLDHDSYLGSGGLLPEPTLATIAPKYGVGLKALGGRRWW